MGEDEIKYYEKKKFKLIGTHSWALAKNAHGPMPGWKISWSIN